MSSIKNIKGWLLPNWDNHFENALIQYSDGWEYQKKQRDFALSYVKGKDIAIDIGANIGFWSKDLCKKFSNVWAFEPHKENILCFKKNLKDFKNWRLEEIALSNENKNDAILFSSPKECGNISLSVNGVTHATTNQTLNFSDLNTSKVNVKKLDNYIDIFEGKNIDFIKVDCQGHEKEIVQGGLNILKKHNCVVVLELPLRNEEEIIYHNELVKIMHSVGYIRRGNLKKETVFTK